MKNTETKIQDFLEKGVENIFPSKDYLAELLQKENRLKMYLGVDPTGPSLHLGHMAALLKLKQFQDLGHQAILLIGDFTATIGDPTGKDKARQTLSKKEVDANVEKYKEQASRILSFGGNNAAQIKFNSEWLSKITLEEMFKWLSTITVDQMLKREMFQRRQKEGNPIFISEFLYPFLQGIDSVFMEVDGEIGGNDQTFNMLIGRELLKTIKNREKFVLAIKLLADSNGKKMGKTEGNMVSLEQKPEEMYGGIMSLTDGFIISALELLTDKNQEEINSYKKELDGGRNPKEIKEILAESIVEINYGKEAAQKASLYFQKVFSEAKTPDNLTTVYFLEEDNLSDALLKMGLVSSKGEFKRMIEQGAIKTLEEDQVLSDFNYIPTPGESFKVGKKLFVKLIQK